ncbi:hypothetical protein ACS0TY_027462 [Phlomoides rotata]
MDLTLQILLLSLLLHRGSLASAVADSPMMLPSTACSDELVTFSSCLPFIAVSPNNLTDFPPPQCCDDVSTAFLNGSAICLCYFVLQPKILGFPLNSTKLLSLTSVCPQKDPNSNANSSLEKLCSESAVLPPLRSITSPNISMPSNSSAESHPPSAMGSAEESSPMKEPTKELPPPQPSLSTITTTISSAAGCLEGLRSSTD